MGDDKKAETAMIHWSQTVRRFIDLGVDAIKAILVIYVLARLDCHCSATGCSVALRPSEQRTAAR